MAATHASSSAWITCVAPAHAIGQVTVTVFNNPGGPGSLTNGFRYLYGPNDQTLAYVWDTSAGIDSKRRWSSGVSRGINTHSDLTSPKSM